MARLNLFLSVECPANTSDRVSPASSTNGTQAVPSLQKSQRKGDEHAKEFHTQGCRGGGRGADGAKRRFRVRADAGHGAAGRTAGRSRRSPGTGKQECKAGDEKTRAECRQEKRDTKQEGRQDGGAENTAPPTNPAQ